MFGTLEIGFVVSVHCFGLTLVCAYTYFKTYGVVIRLIIACHVVILCRMHSWETGIDFCFIARRMFA